MPNSESKTTTKRASSAGYRSTPSRIIEQLKPQSVFSKMMLRANIRPFPCWVTLILMAVFSLLSDLRVRGAEAFSPPKTPPSKVLVTGASGRTGRLVFEQLLEDPRYEPLALVRSTRSGKMLRRRVPKTDLSQVIVCDVTTLAEELADPPHTMESCEAMIICTSAVPSVSKFSLVKTFLKVPFNLIRRKRAIDFRKLKFIWKNGGYPEKVDYEGQLAQIDLAKTLGIKLVVVVGSMGGTDPKNFLNAVGKNSDGSGNGDILLWKRKAEKYLVKSGLDYTIIHPGGLIDKGHGGAEDFVLDVDDVLMAQRCRICRADVARLCVASLSVGKGKKLSFDCITRAPQEGEESKTSAKRSSTTRTAEQALSDFVEQAKTYNYAL